MSEGLGTGDPARIETFPSWDTGQSRLDLQPLWRLGPAVGGPNPRLLAAGLSLNGGALQHRADGTHGSA